MTAPIPRSVILEALEREESKRACERSLHEFVRQAWPIIEPDKTFVDNWHLHVICDHLMAVTAGEIDNLIINMPPGCMKSILVSVAWPAWEWIKKPSLRYLGASYGIDLAIRDASKCRDIVVSDWYQARWPNVRIKHGADQKTKYETTASGWRMATSVDGRATGEHPDRKLVDDAHNAKQAESDAERVNALNWFDRTLSSRGLSRDAKTIIVMQRLHDNDLTGHVLASQTGYEHLCLPMEFESRRVKTTSIGWIDPRKKDGDLLWPELFSAKKVENHKKILGEYGVSGQLQQNPSPVGGGILKVRDHIQLWPRDVPLPMMQFVVQSYDTAFTESTQGCPTAHTAWGVFEFQKQRCAVLLDAWAEHLGYPELRTRALRDWHATYGGTKGDVLLKPRKPDVVLIEQKGSGQSLIQDLRAAHVPVAVWPPKGQVMPDKIARAHQAAPILEIDVIFVIETSRPYTAHEVEMDWKKCYIGWAHAFLEQLERFPAVELKDYVDTFTQAMIYLRDNGQLTLPEADPEDEPEDRDYDMKRKARLNPYAQ